jgi:hypothetical protein
VNTSPKVYGDGHSRGAAGPVSALDRPPVRRTIVAAKVPDVADGVTEPIGADAPDWCPWLVIEDDGGATLIAFPGAGGALAVPVKTGQAVWIGDGSCGIGYSGVAPTRDVILFMGSHNDALIATAGRKDMPITGTIAVLPSTTEQQFTELVTTPNADPDPVATLVPFSAAGVALYLQSAPTGVNSADITVPFVNDDRSVIIVADSEANALAGIGVAVLPGGTVDWIGECWICEFLADPDVTDSFMLVRVTS